MYGKLAGTGAATTGVAATGVQQLPDTGGLDIMTYLYLAMAFVAIMTLLVAGKAIWSLVPREEK
jgi:hypothetical protein